MALLNSSLPSRAPIATGALRARSAGWTGTVRLVLALALALATTSARPAAFPREYQIKAVFLFNFLQFVQWPERAFSGPHDPFRIAILGDDPFGPDLENVVRNETIRQRPVHLQRAKRWEDVRDCHLVFVSASERYRQAEILRGLASRPILTVSEIPGFAERGGVVNFFLEDQKVRFEINPTAARRRDIRLSAQLLNLARIIGPPSGLDE